MDLPFELVEYIFSLLKPKDKISMVCVCKWDLKYELKVDWHKKGTILTCPNFSIKAKNTYIANRYIKGTMIFYEDEEPFYIVFKEDKATIWKLISVYECFIDDYMDDIVERFGLLMDENCQSLSLDHKSSHTILAYQHKRRFCILTKDI